MPTTNRVIRAAAWALVPLAVVGAVIVVLLENAAPYEASPLDERLLLPAFGAATIVGAILLARRPGNSISWMLAGAGLVIAIAPPLEFYAETVTRVQGSPDAVATFGLWLSWYWLPLLGVFFVMIPLRFPDGIPPSQRWRWVDRGLIAVFVLLTLAGMFSDELSGQERAYPANAVPTASAFTCEPHEDQPATQLCHVVIDNPVGLPGVLNPEESGVLGILLAALPIGVVVGVAAIVVRFRRSRGVERQQMKWFLFAVLLLPVPIFLEGVPILGTIMFPVAIAALPTAIGIAILRYRLYDIDRVISRTVSYGLLTAALAGLYALVAVVPVVALDLGTQSEPLVAAGTLAVAAAFGPLRRRFQSVIDRAFARASYDAARTVEAFSRRVRDEVELDQLGTDLRTVIEQTFQPSLVTLWVPTAHSSGSPSASAAPGGDGPGRR